MRFLSICLIGCCLLGVVTSLGARPVGLIGGKNTSYAEAILYNFLNMGSLNKSVLELSAGDDAILSTYQNFLRTVAEAKESKKTVAIKPVVDMLATYGFVEPARESSPLVVLSAFMASGAADKVQVKCGRTVPVRLNFEPDKTLEELYNQSCMRSSSTENCLATDEKGQLPEFVIVQLNRRDSKIQGSLRSPVEVLILDPGAIKGTFDKKKFDEDPSKAAYSLIGVVVHRGRTLEDGPYCAYIKESADPKKIWYYCDGSTVTPITTKQGAMLRDAADVVVGSEKKKIKSLDDIGQHGYLFFYRKAQLEASEGQIKKLMGKKVRGPEKEQQEEFKKQILREEPQKEQRKEILKKEEEPEFQGSKILAKFGEEKPYVSVQRPEIAPLIIPSPTEPEKMVPIELEGLMGRPVGLTNIGNSCYMNSCAQNMFNMWGLSADIGKIEKSDSLLVNAYQQLLSAIAKITGSEAVSDAVMSDFQAAIVQLAKQEQWQPGTQQDPSEMWLHLMKDEMVGRTINRYCLLPRVQKHFSVEYGEKKPQLRSVKQAEPEPLLAITLKKDKTLVELIEDELTASVMSYDELETHKIVFDVGIKQELPEFIVVMLRRYAWDEKLKMSNKLSWPIVGDLETLTLKHEWLCRPSNTHDRNCSGQVSKNLDTTYNLIGAVVHYGASLYGGHYCAYINPQPGPRPWYFCEDAYVTQINDNGGGLAMATNQKFGWNRLIPLQDIRTNGYLLFYRKKSFIDDDTKAVLQQWHELSGELKKPKEQRKLSKFSLLPKLQGVIEQLAMPEVKFGTWGALPSVSPSVQKIIKNHADAEVLLNEFTQALEETAPFGLAAALEKGSLQTGQLKHQAITAVPFYSGTGAQFVADYVALQEYCLKYPEKKCSTSTAQPWLDALKQLN